MKFFIQDLIPYNIHERVNSQYIGLTRLSMDLKVMSKSYKGLGMILAVIDQITNLIVIDHVH